MCGYQDDFVSVGFNGIPPLSKEAVSEWSRTGRVQSKEMPQDSLPSVGYFTTLPEMKLGGNTDM